MASGSYILRVGSHYYIGSSFRIDRRKRDHLWRLKNGIHPIPLLQKAWDKIADVSAFSIISVDFVPPQIDRTAWRSALRMAEQKLIDTHAGDPFLCNRSMDARAPDCPRVLSAAGRAAISAASKNREVSEDTRAKMAGAKRGAKNPKSREVAVIDPDGVETRYPSGTAAAAFFGVAQQVLDHWLRGVVPWPGAGRASRRKNRWIIPYRASYL